MSIAGCSFWLPLRPETQPRCIAEVMQIWLQVHKENAQKRLEEGLAPRFALRAEFVSRPGTP